METRLCDIQNLNSEEALRGLELAGEILRGGGLVGFPTETVYGLGANAFDAEAVASIFAAKGRPGDNPLIVHVPRVEQARELVEFTPLAEKLAERYWPGPLTMVLESRGLVPASVSAGLSTLAVRLPSHPGALAMLRAAERPIAAPSANLSGRPSPTLASHVLEDMQGRVPLILDGGAVEIGLESTVVDARGEYPILLRPGKITQEELRLLCGDCPAAGQADCARPASPGMKYRHYAPQGQLFLVKTWREAEARRLQLLQEGLPLPLLLLSDESAGELQQRGVPEEQIISLGSEARPEEFAHNLFAALREADHRAASHIIGQSIPAIGLGAAVMNRYTKAASKK